ncbi:hypothetical protein Btru_032394 [Bulinus truncatus]|nr:hypothetical protein Btru_032394 [Bulinus truncatus]
MVLLHGKKNSQTVELELTSNLPAKAPRKKQTKKTMSAKVLVVRAMAHNRHVKFAKIKLFQQVHSSSALNCSSFSSTSSLSQLDISGIFPPIPTPFNKDETIAFDKLEINMEKWNKIPFKEEEANGAKCGLLLSIA